MSEQRVSSATQERRKPSRKRVVLRGKVVYDEGRYTLDCLIRDLTPKGAKITVQKGVSMPTHVYLIDIPSGIAYGAEVTWIRTPVFGLKFLRTHRLTDTLEKELQYLTRFWLNCSR
jgi:hypothetical protein